MAKLWIVVLLVFPRMLIRAQTPDTAALRGTVTAPTRTLDSVIRVSVQDGRHHLLRQLTTSSDGSFTVAGLPVGPVFVEAQSATLEAVSEEITLSAGSTATVRLQLHLSAVHEEVVVTGAADEVRTDEPQLGIRLTSAQMQAMPLPNRRITYLPLLNAANHPAINQGDAFMNQDLFTANGTGRRQTWYEVNGANGNDMWGRQTIFTNLPLDAISTMTVLDNAFAADYGFGEGAVVNIVSGSGGARFHGKALAMWRPSGPEAKLAGFTPTNAASGTDITNDTLAQGALTAGGPIAEKTYFLASGEYSYQNRASPVISPVAPGNFIGRYRDWMGYLRVDHAFSDTQRVFLHLGADAFYDTNPSGLVGGNTLPSVGRSFRRRTYTGELGDTAALSSRMVNELRAQFQLASPITQFSPLIYGTQYSVPISSGGTFTSGTSQAALLQNRQFEAVDTLSATFRKSELRSGFDVIHARSGGNSKEFGGPIFLGQLLYKTCTQAAAYCESSAYLNDIANVQSYTQSYGSDSYTANDTLAALFVQWDIHPSNHMTLNAGVRYELQTLTDARMDFAPRIGFAYDLEGKGTTTLRGGFGIYYSQIPDNAVANYALTGPTGVFNYTAQAGQVGFPSSVSAVPLPSFPSGARLPLRSLYIRPGRPAYYNQFLPTGDLLGYPNALRNPYNEQWTLGIEQELAPNWILGADYVGSHTLAIQRPLDVDPPASLTRTAPGMTRSAQAANCSRPYWIAWHEEMGLRCDPSSNQGKSSPLPPYSVILSDVNDGVAYYNALEVNLHHRGHDGSTFLISYVYSHAIDTVDPDIPNQNPNDPRDPVAAERASAIFDQRHRLVLSGSWMAPWGLSAGGIATIAGGLPYNIVTGVNNGGDTGATTDRPVINGMVMGRNSGRGTPIYDLAPFVEKRVTIVPDRLSATVRTEAFNALNHRNVVGFSGVWGNGAAPGLGYGQPLTGITNQLPARELQLSLHFDF